MQCLMCVKVCMHPKEPEEPIELQLTIKTCLRAAGGS